MTSDKDARIAELERKLAEQQVLLKKKDDALATCDTDWADGCYGTLKEQIYDIDKVENAKSKTSGSEELNNLLVKAKEEGKKEAVPEGFVSINIKLLKDASDSLKDYLLDIGWGQSDMSIMAELDAVINYSYKLQGETK